jgi:hypothetical protein
VKAQAEGGRRSLSGGREGGVPRRRKHPGHPGDRRSRVSRQEQRGVAISDAEPSTRSFPDTSGEPLPHTACLPTLPSMRPWPPTPASMEIDASRVSSQAPQLCNALSVPGRNAGAGTCSSRAMASIGVEQQEGIVLRNRHAPPQTKDPLDALIGARLPDRSSPPTACLLIAL